MDAKRLRADEFALRVAGAADELAVAALAAHELRTALGALLVERLVRLAGLARTVDQAARGLALRVAGAGQERPKAAALDGHLFAAIVAVFSGRFALDFLGAHFRRKVTDIVALGVATAAQEEAVAADAFEQLALAALLALLACRNAGFVRLHFPFGLFQIILEAVVEVLDRLLPGQLALLDFVEFYFHARSEADVEDVLEAFHQQLADLLAEHGRGEAALVLADVFALHDGGNDRGVGGGPADALLFELLHQRGFGVARRRLGEMLLGTDLLQAERLALGHTRQVTAFGIRLVALLRLLIFLCGLIDG